MKYGVCGDPELAGIARDIGYDYFEWSVGGLLHPREDESVFETALEEVKKTNFPCPALNVFIPGDLKITGPDVNLHSLETFVKIALRRAEIANIETIVFGSGGARRIPDGFSRSVAWQQLVTFCQMLGPIAQQHHVTIAIEPLNLAECNVLNTVSESADLAREANHPNIRVLVDGYHWAKDNDSKAGILDNANWLVHAHVATVEGRLPPHPGDTCADFFTVLRQAKYSGRVSIEAKITDPRRELRHALDIMQSWTG